MVVSDLPPEGGSHELLNPIFRLKAEDTTALRYNPSDMPTERTLAIIKPDAVSARHAGRILQRIEEAGFQIRAMRLVHLTRPEAEGFYAVHRERPFFASLTTFMSSGPAIVMALEAPDAIRKWRTLMGATDPGKADAGTLRKDFGQSIERNATHGSDAPETAAYELGYFFAGVELVR
jgi:nucleoside-diphosphate kinase